MLEKTGALILTRSELSQIQSGQVPDRIAQTWGLSLPELSAIIASSQYTLLDSLT
jgi:hypothetical protein